MSEQLIYTLCRSGVGVTAGYGVYSTSAGMSAADRAEIEAKYSLYTAPESIPVSGADDPNIARMPVSLGFARLGSGSECITRQVYTGADYDNPARMGNFISHSITDPCFPFHPIEALGFQGFCGDMHYEEMDCSVAPPVLPAMEVSCPDITGRVKAFVAGHDKAFLRELAYRMLDAVDDRLKRVFVAEGYDNADWMAAATMLLPAGLSKSVSFITYTGTPGRCFHKLAGIFDDGPQPPEVSLFKISVKGLKESERDPLFDSYVDGAYAEGSDREAFFAFLSRMGWKEAGKRLINAYHLFSVCEKGYVPPAELCHKCTDALKAVIGSATDRDIRLAYDAVKGAMDDGDAAFYKEAASSAVKDRALADRMLAELAVRSLEPFRGLEDGRSIAESYAGNAGAVSDCLRLGAAGMLDFPAGRYYCLKDWMASGRKEAADALSGYSDPGEAFAEAACEDADVFISAVGDGSPLPDSAKRFLKDKMAGMEARLPKEVLGKVFGYALEKDQALASALFEGVSSRTDGLAVKEEFIDAAIGVGSMDLAETMAEEYVERAIGGDLKHAISFIGPRASSVGNEAPRRLLSALAQSIDFSSYGPLPAAVEALRMFPEMEGMLPADDVSRIRMLAAADEIRRSGTVDGLLDLSGLKDPEAFVALCIKGPLPQKNVESWISDRMRWFKDCPDAAAKRMQAMIARSGAGEDADAISAFIKSAKSIGASDEAVFASLRLDRKTARKVRKQIPEDLQAAFDKYYVEEEEQPGTLKGLLSRTTKGSEAKKEDSKKPEAKEEPKKGGLFGLFKR